MVQNHSKYDDLISEQPLRDVMKLLQDLMKKIGQKCSIFSGTEVIIVGSLKENTKISHLDEADCLLVLDSKKRFEDFQEFNEKDQEQGMTIWCAK